MKKLHGVSSVAPVIRTALLLAFVIPLGQAQTDANAQANATVRGGRFPRQITLYDRQGNLVRTLGDPGDYDLPTLSPDGTRLAVLLTDPTRPRVSSAAHPTRRSVVPDLLVFDLATGTRTVVASAPELRAHVWSADGSQIVYSSYREGYTGLYRKASDGTGTEQLLYRHEPFVVTPRVTDWSSDGRFLTFEVDGVLWVLPLTTQQTAIELLREEYEADMPRFSPDSSFLAYRSNESGRDEVYVRAFDPSLIRFSPVGERWQVSDQVPAGPTDPLLLGAVVQWGPDGRELYYQATDGGVMAVEVNTTPTFQASSPKLLFGAPASSLGNISGDGQLFAFAVPMAPARTVGTVARETLVQYAGTYLGPEESTAVVSLEGSQLLIQETGGTKFPLFPESDTYFFRRSPDRDTDIEFVKDDKGVITHFVRYSGGSGGQEWPRKRD